MQDLDKLLGLDPADPLTRRARALLEADRRLLAELVHRRRELGLTQAEVARRMDISQSAVARIEAGGRDLHQSTIRRYSMAVEAVVEHQVIVDDPARKRAAKMLDQHQDALRLSGAEAWRELAGRHVERENWASLVRKSRTKADA